MGGPASPAHSWQPSWPRRLRKSCSWAQRLRSRVAPQRAGDGTSSTHDCGLSKYWGLGTGTRGQGQEGNGTRGHWGYTGTWGIQVAKRHWGTLGRGGVQGYRDVEGHGGCGHVGMWGVMGTLGHGVMEIGGTAWGHKAWGRGGHGDMGSWRQGGHRGMGTQGHTRTWGDIGWAKRYERTWGTGRHGETEA